MGLGARGAVQPDSTPGVAGINTFTVRFTMSAQGRGAGAAAPAQAQGQLDVGRWLQENGRGGRDGVDE